MAEHEFLKFALQYAARGWRVIPLRPKSKVPLTRHGSLDGTTDEETIRRWWAQWPDANVGICTGPESGLVVVDVDPRNGGEDAVVDLEAQGRTLPDTATVQTGGGGRHLYYACSAYVRNAELRSGIDLKGAGGYVVAPPSVHPETGRAYFWDTETGDVQCQLTPLPSWCMNGNRHTPRVKTQDDPTVVKPIEQGTRNSTLTSVAGALRRHGCEYETILRALREENRTRCKPPLPDEEVRRIAWSVSRYEPSLPSEFGEVGDHPATGDRAHAEALATVLRDRYRWAVHRGSWMGYENGVWSPVDEDRMLYVAAETLRSEYQRRISTATDADEIKRLSKGLVDVCQHPRVARAVAFLRGWPGFHTEAEQWDAQAWVLNVANGTIDLRTGELRPHDPNDLFTQITTAPYEGPRRAGPWVEHIMRFLPSQNVRRQVQRDLGLSLIGAHVDEVLSIWWGSGGNGKSTTIAAIQRTLGTYARRAAPELLLYSSHDRHPTEIADLAGARLVFTVEVDDGKRLAEALVKDLTGGDVIKARYLFRDFFEIRPTWYITLIVNHKPIVMGTDHAIWRRIRLIPWTETILPEERRPQDEVLQELLDDGPAILAWLVEGLQDWQEDHGWIADEVIAATDEYRAEQDVLAAFLADCCELGSRHSVGGAELYDAYVDWCTRSGEEPLTRRVFARHLKQRGISPSRIGRSAQRGWVGVRLREQD